LKTNVNGHPDFALSLMKSKGKPTCKVEAVMTMKNGQCRSCGSYQIRSNKNRKFPALNTMTLGLGNSNARYASLDTYVCVNCGYVESYVASADDLNYIQEHWAKVEAPSENGRSPNNVKSLPSRTHEDLKRRAMHG
jgi:predicted RNA-binding Zn-ribbon protein involved in translation (DUF1610 family)